MEIRSETVTAYIGLGSNIGDRAGNLLYAVRGLREASFEVEKLSAVYETEPIGMVISDRFLNMVAEVRASAVTPSQMMARMLRIEYLLGRKDKNLKKPRTIDLDLLFFADHKCETPFLTLPHPRAHLRRFVLAPMAEIAPELVHPTLNMTMEHLLEECGDTSIVERWNPQGQTAGSLAHGG